MTKKIKFLWLITLLFFSFNGQAQIQGNVLDVDKQPIEFVTVVLKKAIDSSFVTYTRTDDNGFYSLNSETEGSFLLSFSSLGYTKKEQNIVVTDVSKTVKINITLQEEIVSLDEVVVQAELDITQKKDTITLSAKAFAQGNEEVVEDLLKKIPGLTVESDGTIKVGNQEVEKVMIEGDDFFERGYKLLVKFHKVVDGS
jgi:hypothetical protein